MSFNYDLLQTSLTSAAVSSIHPGISTAKSKSLPRIITPTTDESETVAYFLADLYTYPSSPSYKIAWNLIDPEMSSKILKPIRTVTPERFVDTRELIDKFISADWYSKKTKSLLASLQAVPVYVVVNGQYESVVATTKSGKSALNTTIGQDFEKDSVFEIDAAQRSFSKRIGSKRIVKKAFSPKSKKFGFIFFDRDEAELYVKAMAESSDNSQYSRRGTGIEKVGLSIHCVTLAHAFLMVKHFTQTIAFRYVPQLTDVARLLHPEKTVHGLEYLDSNKKGRIKGVPIYLLQFRYKPRKNRIDIRDKISDLTVGLREAVISGSDTVIRPNIAKKERHIKFEKFTKYNPKGVINYVLFNKDEAIALVDKCNRWLPISDFENSSGLKTDYTTIYTYNLEDFLETWEESLLSETTTLSRGGNKPIYFIPSERSRNDVGQYYEKPNVSLGKSIKVWGRRKLDKLFWFQKNYLGLILRGSRI